MTKRAQVLPSQSSQSGYSQTLQHLIFVSFFILFCLFGVVLGLCHGALASLFQSMSGMWDFSSLTRDQIYIHCIGRWILNHWTTREVSALASLNPSV